MGKNKNIPLYDIIVDPDNMDAGMYKISLVTNPAIQENFIYFSEEESSFKFVDQERGVIVGPVIVPDKPIYRRNDSMGEFYVQFSKDTIEKMMRNYAKKGLHNSFNLQHQYDTQDVYMLEIWMKEGEQDKSNLYGFDLPVGTVFAMAQVESPVIREEIKASGLNGFSIEIKGFDIVESFSNEESMDFKFAVELGERLAKMEAKVAELEHKNETLMELWAEGQEQFNEVTNEELSEEVTENEVKEELAQEEPVVEEVLSEQEVQVEEVQLQEEVPAVNEEIQLEAEEVSVEQAELALSAEQENEGQVVESVDKTVKFERITAEKINMIDKFFGKRLY